MCIVMGRLYTWNAAILAANDIPGWHLPSKKEWEELLEFLGPDSVRYDRIISSETGFSPQWAGVRVFTGDYKAAGLEAVNYCRKDVKLANRMGWRLPTVTELCSCFFPVHIMGILTGFEQFTCLLVTGVCFYY